MTGLIDTAGGLALGPGLSWQKGGLGAPGGADLILPNVATGFPGFTSGWTTGNATLGTGVAGDPVGGSNAARVTEDTTTNGHSINSSLGGNIQLVANATLLIEVYTKLGSSGTRNSQIALFDSSFASSFGATFNASTGALVATTMTGTGIVAATPPATVKNGWQKIVVIGRVGNFKLGVLFLSLYSGSTGTYLGDGASNNLFYGAVVTQGSVAP